MVPLVSISQRLREKDPGLMIFYTRSAAKKAASIYDLRKGRGPRLGRLHQNPVEWFVAS